MKFIEVEEEGVKIRKYGEKITKKNTVFYNPIMKLNRDLSLLVISNYFDKKIKYCDPMVASGIREIRFLHKIPNKFSMMILGDISEKAIKEMKHNFEINNINLENLNSPKIIIRNDDAINTINSNFFDFIEVDPFGSPVPFLDIAIQKTKHKGILSVTATDTAALCGTYPKTTFRKYFIKVKKTLWFEELGLRNLIAYVQRIGAKYEKNLIPLVSYSSDHYYKIFFKVEQSRTKSYETLKSLKYINWNNKTQEIKIEEFENEFALGKTYVGKLNNKEFINKMLNSTNLIENNKKVEKILTSLKEELDLVGYYNPHKFAKEYKFPLNKKFIEIIESVKKEGYKISKVHNNRLGLKTNMPAEKFIELLKKN
jgi:tRNA (guanine26-N2/guanine27-N2)-dimethyltransferase